MSARVELVREVEDAMSNSPEERRLNIMRRVTDLFVDHAPNFSDVETGLFDDVMDHLMRHVESRALIELSRRLAAIDNAPLRTVKDLASCDDIEVSGPMLTYSSRLTDAELITIARSKSQAHMESIAGRPSINAAVTDALVEHGNAAVHQMVAGNAGAHFSALGMAKLSLRADGDEALTGALLQRSDLPRPVFRKLMLQATVVVRERLLKIAAPEQAPMIGQVLDEIASQFNRNRRLPVDLVEAERAVSGLKQDNRNLRTRVYEYAGAKSAVRLVAALSLLSGMPVALVDKLVFAPNDFGLITLCRALLLDWKTTFLVIKVRPNGEEVPAYMFDLEAQFRALSPASALRLVQFWQSRQNQDDPAPYVI